MKNKDPKEKKWVQVDSVQRNVPIADNQDPTWHDPSRVNFFGYSLPKSAIYTSIALLLMLLLSAGGFAWFISQQKSAKEAAPVSQTAGSTSKVLVEVKPWEIVPSGEMSEVSSVVRFHRELTGAATVDSFVAKGTFRTSGLDFEITQLAKYPHFYRQILRVQDTVIDAGFDGQAYWQENPVAESMGDEAAASDLNRILLLLECGLTRLHWQIELSGHDGMELLENAVRSGRHCYVVANTAWIEGKVLHFIDVETAHEIGREAYFTLRDQPMVISVEYSEFPDPSDADADPGDSNTLGLPRAYRVTLNGTEVVEARFDTIRANIGILPALFQP